MFMLNPWKGTSCSLNLTDIHKRFGVNYLSNDVTPNDFIDDNLALFDECIDLWIDSCEKLLSEYKNFDFDGGESNPEFLELKVWVENIIWN